MQPWLPEELLGQGTGNHIADKTTGSWVWANQTLFRKNHTQPSKLPGFLWSFPGFSRLLVGQKLDGILCPSSNGFSAPQGFRGRRGRDDDHLTAWRDEKDQT